jgi:hypothetical protein
MSIRQIRWTSPFSKVTDDPARRIGLRGGAGKATDGLGRQIRSCSPSLTLGTYHPIHPGNTPYTAPTFRGIQYIMGEVVVGIIY